MHTLTGKSFARTALYGILLAASLGQSALAIDYGIYDARALAMGGTTLAVGNTAQGQYYNPALWLFTRATRIKLATVAPISPRSWYTQRIP